MVFHNGGFSGGEITIKMELKYFRLTPSPNPFPYKEKGNQNSGKNQLSS